MSAPARARLRSALAAPLVAVLAAAPLAVLGTGVLVSAASAQQADEKPAETPDVDAGIGPAAQIAELERQIARDRTTLRELIGQRSAGRADIANDPRLRE